MSELLDRVIEYFRQRKINRQREARGYWFDLYQDLLEAHVETCKESDSKTEAMKFAQEAIRDNLKAYHYKNKELLLEAFNRLGEHTGEKIEVKSE